LTKELYKNSSPTTGDLIKHWYDNPAETWQNKKVQKELMGSIVLFGDPGLDLNGNY